mmetsp:Transcript_116779/g.330379  ORF Transcript_116779/g.330379 Transcript_116779/m.330379 type:complete len:216 (+) Transcript_116779:486-1133(+)
MLGAATFRAPQILAPHAGRAQRAVQRQRLPHRVSIRKCFQDDILNAPLRPHRAPDRVHGHRVFAPAILGGSGELIENRQAPTMAGPAVGHGSVEDRSIDARTHSLAHAPDLARSRNFKYSSILEMGRALRREDTIAADWGEAALLVIHSRTDLAHPRHGIDIRRYQGNFALAKAGAEVVPHHRKGRPAVFPAVHLRDHIQEGPHPSEGNARERRL